VPSSCLAVRFMFEVVHACVVEVYSVS
jgi:hypothetical protein